MTSTPAAPRATTRRRTPIAFDPFLATFEEETWRPESGSARLHFFCPSRRAGAPGYVLTCEEDGTLPWCSCDGYARWGHCTHQGQAAEIVRIAFANIYAALPEPDLIVLDHDLTARFRSGPCVASIRFDVLGDELAKRARMKDRPLLNLRGQRAKSELFG